MVGPVQPNVMLSPSGSQSTFWEALAAASREKKRI
jgi:hypothetical protein